MKWYCRKTTNICESVNGIFWLMEVVEKGRTGKARKCC
jgi:hypothetical protein